MVEKVTKKAVTENSKKNGKYYHISNPEKYYKQIIAAVNAKGEKEVWVNCFCSIANKPNWRKNVIITLDGGTCYFSLKINLTNNTHYNFMVDNFE